MKFLYTLGVRGYASAIRLAAPFNPKANKWMQGRKEVWSKLQSWKRNETGNVYWFHCASLGEFEQGRPLIEALKKKEKCQIVLTFFSPSGYEIRKDYEFADLVTYLPRETTRNVQRFYDIIKPTSAFFIKYEFWALYIQEVKKRGVHLYSISAIFRENQLFFRSYGGYMRNQLKTFDHIFVQDKHSAELLKSIQVKSTVAGDTRYDRVMENAQKVKPFPLVEDFVNGRKVFMVGSSWEEDEEIIAPYLNSSGFEYIVIIAPHEIGERRIRSIEERFKMKSVRYSALKQGGISVESQLLIIDNIGMLMHLYQYADIAYVGGAFGKGLHNILEPACFGNPVIFGEKYAKFNEAVEFIKEGIGFSVTSAAEFEHVFQQLSSADLEVKVQQFMQSKTGATQKILTTIA